MVLNVHAKKYQVTEAGKGKDAEHKYAKNVSLVLLLQNYFTGCHATNIFTAQLQHNNVQQ